MATIKDTVWPITPHTEAKHAILRMYLGAWFPILTHYGTPAVYIDGFAGPGEYSGGQKGSPLIALEVAALHRAQIQAPLRFWFVEEKATRVANLQRLIGGQVLQPRIAVDVVHGEFEKEFPRILDVLAAGRERAPSIFAFIDPFGFEGVPMALIHRLLQMDRAEAFITFNERDVNRFLEHPNPAVTDNFVTLFGTEAVRDLVLLHGHDRFEALRSLYQQCLRKHARFVRYFHMRDRHNQPIYDLFFATNNDLGHRKMKETMWSVDPDGLFRFSDATNAFQPILFTEDNTQTVRDAIVRQFEGRRNVDAAMVKRWLRDETAYIDRHATAGLKRAETDGGLSVAQMKADGSKRRPGSFPDGVLLDFSQANEAP